QGVAGARLVDFEVTEAGHAVGGGGGLGAAQGGAIGVVQGHRDLGGGVIDGVVLGVFDAGRHRDGGRAGIGRTGLGGEDDLGRVGRGDGKGAGGVSRQGRGR